jgi:hypothetical protein
MAESASGSAEAFAGLVAGLAAAAVGMLQRVGSLLDGNGAARAPAADQAGPGGRSPERQDESIRTGLAGARHYLDTLEMLRQKTKGNLTQDEEQLLDSVLADLKITFVKVNDRWTSAKSG